ncbi:MAG: hypothetical protein AAF378_17840 [Cyanobacteria bacterium P01_A01_bin.84]
MTGLESVLNPSQPGMLGLQLQKRIFIEIWYDNSLDFSLPQDLRNEDLSLRPKRSIGKHKLYRADYVNARFLRLRRYRS